MVYCLRGRIPGEEANPLSRFFVRTYRPLAAWALAHRGATLAGATLVLMLTALPLVGLEGVADRARPLVEAATAPSRALPVRRLGGALGWMTETGAHWFPGLGREFMPPLDEGDLLYMPTTDPGVSITKAREILQQTDRLIATFPEVHHVFGKIGRADTATDPAPLSMIESTIMLEQDRSRWRRVGVSRFFEDWPEPLRGWLAKLWPLDRPITVSELVGGYETAGGERVPGLNDTVKLPAVS